MQFSCFSTRLAVPHSVLALACALGLGPAVAVAQNNVLSFDTSADSTVSATAFLLVAQGTQYQGELFASFESATAQSFAGQLLDGSHDIAILDLTNGRPDDGWVDAFETFVSAGGCAVVTVRDPADAAALAPILDASVGASHDDLSVTRWNSSTLFDSSQTLLDTLVPGDDAWEPNGFFLEPTAGGTAAAGFGPVPAANQAAIVVGNNGRTILHGFLPDDMVPGDADADTIPDMQELAENELFAVALAGCRAPQSTLDIPTQSTAGLVLLAGVLGALGLVGLRFRRS